MKHKIDNYNFELGKCIKREQSGPFPNVVYWYYMHKYLKISIYYDVNDDLGIVGEPYYEIYNVSVSLSENNFEDTLRFLSEDEMIEELENQARIHEKEIEVYPERFIWIEKLD